MPVIPENIACQVIGCTPRVATMWLSPERLFACARCGQELLELQRLQKLGTDAARAGSRR